MNEWRQLETGFLQSPKGKCGLIPIATWHLRQLRNVIVAQVVHLAYNILACKLCAGAR